MLLEQSARLENKWYLNMILALLSNSLAYLVSKHSIGNGVTANEVVEDVIKEFHGDEKNTHSFQYLLRYHPELLFLDEPWKAYGYRGSLKMDAIKAQIALDPAGRVDGLPLRVVSRISLKELKGAVAESIRYRTRSLTYSPFVVTSADAFTSDILAVCAAFGVKKATITTSDVEPSSKLFSISRYSTRDTDRWLQGELDLRDYSSLRAFMHLMANPSDYSIGGHTIVAGKQLLIASYTKRSDLSVEEEASSLLSGIKAMDSYSHPLLDTVLTDRAEAIGVRRNFYEYVLEYGLDKVRQVLADAEDLYDTLPAIALYPSLQRLEEKGSQSYYKTKMLSNSESEVASLMLAISADPGLSSLLVTTDKASKNHPLVDTFLRMAQAEGSEHALAVTHAVLKMLGAGELLSSIVGKENDREAINGAVAHLEATIAKDKTEEDDD